MDDTRLLVIALLLGVAAACGSAFGFPLLDDANDAELNHRIQQEINEKIAAHHAALMTACREMRVTVEVDGEYMICRPIRRSPK